MRKAIIFDFDGVLVLSERARFNALRKSARKSQIKIDENLFDHIVGRTTKIFLNEVLSDKQKSYIPSIMDEQQRSYKSKIEYFVKPIDLIINFVKKYEGTALFAVASMSERHVIEKILKRFGILSKFKIIISQEDVVQHKPHPEIYYKAINQLGIPTKYCVAIEDSVIGLDAARAAGLDCYVLLNEINDKSQFLKKDVKGFITSERDLENYFN